MQLIFFSLLASRSKSNITGLELHLSERVIQPINQSNGDGGLLAGLTTV